MHKTTFLIAAVSFLFISYYANADENLYNSRYMSPEEATEELVGEWEIVGIGDSVFGPSMEFEPGFLINFYSDGSYTIGQVEADMREGIWQVFEQDHQTYIRMKLLGSPYWTTARLIFNDGVKLLEGRLSDELQEYDLTFLERH